ncbi:hypothetical protein P7C70_g1963, partial [Phenoliferia sp. Uapishka_3]
MAATVTPPSSPTLDYSSPSYLNYDNAPDLPPLEPPFIEVPSQLSLIDKSSTTLGKEAKRVEVSFSQFQVGGPRTPDKEILMGGVQLLGQAVLQYVATDLAVASSAGTEFEIKSFADPLLSRMLHKHLTKEYDLPERLDLSYKQANKHPLYDKVFATYVGMIQLEKGAMQAIEWVRKVFEKQLALFEEAKEARMHVDEDSKSEGGKKENEGKMEEGVDVSPSSEASVGPSPPSISGPSLPPSMLQSSISSGPPKSYISIIEEWRAQNKKPTNLFKDLGENPKEAGQPSVFSFSLEVNGLTLKGSDKTKKGAKENWFTELQKLLPSDLGLFIDFIPEVGESSGTSTHGEEPELLIVLGVFYRQLILFQDSNDNRSLESFKLAPIPCFLRPTKAMGAQ